MLIGKRLQLRYLEDTDLDFLYKIENDEKLWQFGSEKQNFSREVLSDYITNAKLDIEITNQLRLIISFQNLAIGIIDLYNYNGKSAGIGILIIEEYQKNGFAKESLMMLKDYCSETLNLQEIFCSIHSSNLNSIKLFTSIGFKEKSELKKLKNFRLKL